MFCEKCGANNSETAVFCRKCGFRIAEDEEETRIAQSARKAADEEKEIFTVRPTMMFIQFGYGAAIVSAFLLVFFLDYVRRQSNTAIPWWFYILAGFALLLIPAYYHLKRNIVRYRLTDSKIEISEGLIATSTRNIPLRNIQDVSVSATVFQRLLGFGNLVIENANQGDGKIILKNIQSPKKYADELLKQMRLIGK